MVPFKKQYCEKVTVNGCMKLLIILWVLISPFLSLSQKEKPQNYKRFDERLLHFGFMLGGNRSNFIVYQNIDAYSKYGLLSLTSKPTAGGQVGIVTTMKLFTPVMRLRMIPTLSFQERVLNYTYVNTEDPSGKNVTVEERISSTDFDLPLMLQFRTLRYNNFAAYVLVGGQYTLDFQSQEKATQNYVDPFIKIRREDFQGQIGAGVEFFAPYFKLGIELKYSQSFKSSFIQDGYDPALPIDRLYNNVIWLSFIFEG